MFCSESGLPHQCRFARRTRGLCDTDFAEVVAARSGTASTSSRGLTSCGAHKVQLSNPTQNESAHHATPVILEDSVRALSCVLLNRMLAMSEKRRCLFVVPPCRENQECAYMRTFDCVTLWFWKENNYATIRDCTEGPPVQGGTFKSR